jgi:hypothetical protein
MKTKKLRSITIILLLLPVCVILLGVGCQEDDKNDYNPTSIIGKWEKIKIGSCVGYSNSVIEFTEDSVFKGYIEDVLTHCSKITIKKSHNEYNYDTIFFKEPGSYQYMFLERIGTDTLNLNPPILTLTALCTTYKRIK